jgi:hypothetical protein
VSRKAGQIVIRILIEKTVQHQKGIDALGRRLTDTAQQTDTGAIPAGTGRNATFDGTAGHCELLVHVALLNESNDCIIVSI